MNFWFSNKNKETFLEFNFLKKKIYFFLGDGKLSKKFFRMTQTTP